VTQEWHYHLGSDQHGPVSFEELQGLAASQQLTPSTLVWKDGMAEWVQASTIAGLLPATPPPPPVPEAIAPPAAPIAPPAAPIAPPAAPIAAPITPPPVAGAPPAVAPVSITAGGSAVLRGSVAQLKARLSLFQLIQLGGAAVLVLSMFLPYWSKTIFNEEFNRSEVEDFQEISEDNDDWYDAHISKAKRREATKQTMELDEGDSVSLTIWGFSTGTGWIGFFFGLLIVSGVLLPLFVAPLQNWDWILALVAAGLSLLVLIMSLLWLLGSPGADAPPLMSQGNSLGPYVVFLASAAVITGATMLALEKLKSAKATTA